MSSAGAVDPLLLRAWQEVSEGIMVLDASTWRVQHANVAGAAVFGRTPDELVGSLLPVVFPDEVRAAFHEQLKHPDSTDVVAWSGEVPEIDRWIAVRARRREDHVLCSFRDVSHERRLQEERDELTASLRGSLERTSDLLRLSEALTATRTVADVAEVVVEAASRSFGAAYSALSVVDHERQLLRTPFTGELAVGAEQEWQDLPLDGPGPGTLAMRQGSPRFDDATSLRTNFPELMHRWEVANVRYLATVPLVAAGVTVGLLTMVWHEDLELSENQRAMLVSLASYSTQALQRALLLAERTTAARTL